MVGDGPSYISFDVDGLDPVYAPGTGTPEIGVITTIEAQAVYLHPKLPQDLHWLSLILLLVGVSTTLKQLCLTHKAMYREVAAYIIAQDLLP